MTDHSNPNKPGRTHEAPQGELKGIHDRIQDYVFRGGKAYCDQELPFKGEHMDELTGEMLPIVEGAQPTYTLPGLTGEQISQGGDKARKAAEVFRVGPQDKVEFNYSTACIVVDSRDGSQEPTPSQVMMTIKREDKGHSQGVPVDVLTVFDESFGMFSSLYEREFEAYPDTANAINTAASLATRAAIESGSQNVSDGDRIEITLAAALEGGSVTSEGVTAMQNIFDLIESENRPPQAL